MPKPGGRKNSRVTYASRLQYATHEPQEQRLATSEDSEDAFETHEGYDENCQVDSESVDEVLERHDTIKYEDYPSVRSTAPNAPERASTSFPALSGAGNRSMPGFASLLSHRNDFLAHQHDYDYQGLWTDRSDWSHGATSSSPTVRAAQARRCTPEIHPTSLQSNRPAGKPQYSSNASQGSSQIVQGIQLVSIRELPDRFRGIFPFPMLNAMQSKCFTTAFNSRDNLVLSSPTGSGKTVVFELAICRAICDHVAGQFKIVYQAPTKALCAERQRDWARKFASFDIQCAELTGDSSVSDLKAVQNAAIIITTPEKWDSTTRKWQDHEKLVRMVRLFLIDEVHMLKDERGATLEAVATRMKSNGSQVRIIALSATIPNPEDIATWLGKDSVNRHIPAAMERFGEEFRPVRLQKHVVGVHTSSNDFAFDKALDNRLPEVISRYSQNKPIMIFCATRISATNTAKLLAHWWSSNGAEGQYWNAPRANMRFSNHDLQQCSESGVSFHHGGLDLIDRQTIESAFLNGNINVICCTSTLAVGINLPCHFVIIKNTVMYEHGLLKEYSDLEIMQMLGRAGRPQFDSSAIAVIMTRTDKADRYENMVSGCEILESCLHNNLTEHLNAEIGMKTVTDLASARKWLRGTFMFVRMNINPAFYSIEGDITKQSLDRRLDQICVEHISDLQDQKLLAESSQLRTTEFGDAMARHYVKFDTMKVFLALPQKAKVSEILAVLAQAAEFGGMYFRSGEKAAYKIINNHPSLRYPIPGDLEQTCHKVSLIIQSNLSGIDFPDEEKLRKHRSQFNIESASIFSHISRMTRCIIDCKLVREDSVSVRNAWMLTRSLGARVWDDSPLQMKQIPDIGPAAVRKLVYAGIKSIDDLEFVESYRIESIMGRAPPFGLRLLGRLKEFPKLRVSLSIAGPPVVKPNEGVQVKLKADVGFLNEQTPTQWSRKPVFVCFLAETSDGRSVLFRRMTAKNLEGGHPVLFTALLQSSAQSIACYVMCDEIAGTQREAVLKPNISASSFATLEPGKGHVSRQSPQQDQVRPDMNSSRKRKLRPSILSDDFGDGDIDDDDLMDAAVDASEFIEIDALEGEGSLPSKTHTAKKHDRGAKTSPATKKPPQERQPKRLPNGNWACNHPCKDKNACRHMCCKDGMEKMPKSSKTKSAVKGRIDNQQGEKKTGAALQKGQTTLNTATRECHASNRRARSSIQQIDLCASNKTRAELCSPEQYSGTIRSLGNSGSHQLRAERRLSTEDLTTKESIQVNSSLPTHVSSDTYGESDSMFNEALVGLADSQALRQTIQSPTPEKVSGDLKSMGTPMAVNSVSKLVEPQPADATPAARTAGSTHEGNAPVGNHKAEVESNAPPEQGAANSRDGAYTSSTLASTTNYDAELFWAINVIGDIFEVV